VEVTLFTSGSALEHKLSSLFWLILLSMLHQTGQNIAGKVNLLPERKSLIVKVLFIKIKV
jgi:hypothetical protein